MSPARGHWPVVVVGAGPTGLALANLLGVQGVDSLLVERNATTVQEPRAVSIDDESLRTMQAAGVVEEVLRHVVPGYGSHYHTAAGTCFAKVEPTGAPFGYPRRNAFRQPRLEAQLRAALGRFAGTEALFGWRLEGFVEGDDRVTLRLGAPGGAVREISTDYLIGCDGATSTVRQALGIALEGTTFDERWLIVDLEDFESTTKHTKVFCNRRRPCITLPGPERTRRYEFKLLPGETDAELLRPETVARLLREHEADPGATIRRTVVYRFHARVAPRWASTGGRVLLAGDAAHLTPPFAGQGMNSGIRDAQNLAWKLAAVLDGRLGPGVLRDYARERKDHVWQMIRLALRMGRIMAPPSALEGWLTQAGFRALNLWPPARDYVAQMKYKPKPRFADGFLVPDGRGARRTLVGRLVPQPRVLLPEGRAVLLDEVLGNRFALLLPGQANPAARALLGDPLWDRLRAVRVVLLPLGERAPEEPGVIQVTEPDGAFAPYAGHALLLRPDHYVAAAIPLANPAGMLATVTALVEATWTRRGDRLGEA